MLVPRGPFCHALEKERGLWDSRPQSLRFFWSRGRPRQRHFETSSPGDEDAGLGDRDGDRRIESEDRGRGLTAVKRKSMRNALVPGRRPRKFPAPKFN